MIKLRPERGEWTYRVDRCEQPWFDVLRHRVFHKVIEPVLEPFAGAIEKLIARYDKRRLDPDDWTIPLDVKFDLWCYELGEKNLRVIESIPVNETTYEALQLID